MRGKLGALKDTYAQSLVADAEARPKRESNAEDDGRDAAKGKREAMKKAYAERRRDVDGAGERRSTRGARAPRRATRRSPPSSCRAPPSSTGSPPPPSRSPSADRAVDDDAVRQTERLHLDDSHAPAVATMLKCMPQLEELSVERNEMHEPGAQFVAILFGHRATRSLPAPPARHHAAGLIALAEAVENTRRLPTSRWATSSPS